MQERELLIFIFGLGVLIYFLFQHRELDLFGSLRLMVFSLVLLTLSWLCNLLDNQWQNDWLRVAEHGFHAAAAACLLAWIWLRQRTRA